MIAPDTGNTATNALCASETTGKHYVSHNHRVARDLAAAGISVFPCKSELNQKKLPHHMPSKAPVTGVFWSKEATTNPKIIDDWWQEKTDALVGIPAKQAGFFIIDADKHPDKADGLSAFEALIAANGGLPETVVIIETQSGGRHYVFNQPEGLVLGNSSGGLPPAVDTRGASGDGGYIIAPGSIWVSPDGQVRQWRPAEGSLSLIEAVRSKKIPEVPEWLISIIRQPKQSNVSDPLLSAGNQPPLSEGAINLVRSAKNAPPPQYSSPAPINNFDVWLEQLKKAEDLVLVSKAIFYVSAESREKWLGYGGALYDRFGEAGRAVWDNWSKTCPDKYDPDGQDKAWRSFGRGYAGRRMTIASIIYDARLAGFGRDKADFQNGSHQNGSDTENYAAHSNAEDDSTSNGAGSSKYESQSRAHNSRPEIQISGGGISYEADQAEAALIAAGVEIFQRGGELVFPCQQEVASFRGSTTKVIVLRQFSEARMTDLLCRYADFKRGDKVVNPPAYLAKTILARTGQWSFPSVSGVSSVPIIKSDGSVVTLPGYDLGTRLYLGALPKMPAMQDDPSQEDTFKALHLLQELVSEFPFADDASRASALSAIISPVVRSLLSTVPIHIASAPTPGTGKSFLIDLVAMVATGEKAPATGYAKSVDENEKRIDGALLDGNPIFSFDNANGELGGDKLCQAIERPVIDVRRLGSSEKHKIENRITIYATGNNILPAGDMTRRSILIRLDASLERPETRQFKTRPDQLIRENRGLYVAACITIVRGYILAGMPNVLPSLPSFENWSDYVRSALVWLGCVDPVETMKSLQNEDPEHQIRTLIFRGFRDAFASRAVTAKQIISAAQETDAGNPDEAFGPVRQTAAFRHPELREGLLEVAGKNEAIISELLGKWLRSNKGRIAGGLRLTCSSTGGAAKWSVVAVG